MEDYLLDTSAILTYTQQEEGWEKIDKLLYGASSGQINLFISFITVVETFYRVWRSHDEKEAHRLVVQLKTLPINHVQPDEDLLLLTGELKALHSLSIADSFVAATAIRKKAILVHKDPDFEMLKDRLELLALPYKKTR